VYDKYFGAKKMRLSFKQWMRLLFGENVFLFKKKPPIEGWAEPTDFYLIRCWRHGYCVTYKQGFFDDLSCPLCIAETLKSIEKMFHFLGESKT
jgi:hypothetical protein